MWDKVADKLDRQSLLTPWAGIRSPEWGRADPSPGDHVKASPEITLFLLKKEGKEKFPFASFPYPARTNQGNTLPPQEEIINSLPTMLAAADTPEQEWAMQQE